MMNPRTLCFAVIVSVGMLLLSGCGHSVTSADGVPFPAIKAPQSAQVQVQQIENDPHIPASAKPGIEAQIVNNTKSTGDKTPTKTQ